MSLTYNQRYHNNYTSSVMIYFMQFPTIYFMSYMLIDIFINGFYVFHTVHHSKPHDETNSCTYKIHTLLIDHTYMSWLPSVTLLSVYSINEYNKSFVCVANQSSSLPAVNLPTSMTGDFTTYKYNLLIILA
jgi:hypothetical protein